jgi:hypothetical protein
MDQNGDCLAAATARTAYEKLLEEISLLSRPAQLRRLLEVLTAADECVEGLEYLTSQAWEYLVQNELWTAGGMTLEEVKRRINWPEVCLRISRHQQAQKRRVREEKAIRTHWGCSPEEALPAEMRPEHLSANLLQQMHRLSKTCPRLEKAQGLMGDMVRQRLGSSGGFKVPHVQVADIIRATEQAIQQAKSAVEVEEEEEEEEEEEVSRKIGDDGEVGIKSKDVVDHALGSCRCPPEVVDLIVAAGSRQDDEKGLAMVRQAIQAGLPRLCRAHLRLLAGCAQLGTQQ